eukprot:2267792-Rhodomonas_salina.1
MKSMKKQDEWRDDIQKRYGAAKDEKATTDLAVLADTLLKGVTTAIKGVSFVHGTGGGGGGGGGGPGILKKGAGGGWFSGFGLRSGRGKALQPSDNGGNAAVLGLIAPNAEAIVGANMK